MGDTVDNALYINSGGSSVDFTRKMDAGAVLTDTPTASSVHFADFDGDGNLDLFITGRTDYEHDIQSLNYVYRNTGSCTFERVTSGSIASDLADSRDATVGDYVYVHTGFAISVVDEAEARESMRLLRELADTYPAEELFLSTGDLAPL